jgi:hypothetical protein
MVSWRDRQLRRKHSRMPGRLAAACCSAATSSSIPGPRNSPLRRPVATAGARVFPPAAAGHCRMPDSRGTADGNDQDQQFEVQGYPILPRSQVAAGTSAPVACLGSFVDGRCLLAVPQSLELEQARTGYPGTGPVFCRSANRYTKRVPEREYQSGFRYSPAPWGLSGLLPINPAAAGLGRIASCCWPCSLRWNARPGDLGRLDERA